jgi:aquaporin NIP
MSEQRATARSILMAEVFGTFCMVFAGTGAIVANHASGGAITHAGIALTFGLVVMTMIYAVGHISGAHMNPAVTIGLIVAGQLRARWVVVYLVGQFVGAMLASLSLRLLFGNIKHLGATLPSGSSSQSFVLEFILTLMLMVVVLLISTGPKEIKPFAGIAIGGLIGLEAMFAGPICGASMNPIRSLAPALVSGHLPHLWIYLCAPPLGALAGVVIFRLMRVKQ